MGVPLVSFPLSSERRFPCSKSKPMPRSRRLYAGYRLVSKSGFFQAYPEKAPPLGFDSIFEVFDTSSTVHCYSSPWHLPDEVLLRLFFSVTLTTMAFDHSSLRWFGAFTCMAAPKGLPSSLIQLTWHTGALPHHLQSRDWNYRSNSFRTQYRVWDHEV